jgi:CheY-like chemotaxis protein
MVTLYLPRGHEIVDMPRDELESDDVNAGSVLLVEDNPEVAEVTGSMLEQLGYRVQPLRDAAAALRAINEQSFDLVISDIVMAGTLDGLGLAHAIREQNSRLPVLLLTGYSQRAEEARGEFIVMRKPVKLAELSRTASRMIAESKQPLGSNVVRLRTAQAKGAAPSLR